MKKLVIFFLTLFLLFITKACFAHPHGWLEVYADLLFENKKLTAIETTWKFDELTSQYIIESADTNSNQQIEPGETREFQRQIQSFVFDTMKSRNYFMTLRINGFRLKIGKVKDVSAQIKDGIIIMKLTYQFFEKLDPINNNISVSFYDESYYYDVYSEDNNSIHLKGDTPTKCSTKLSEDDEHAYYFDMVNPQIINLYCLE